jgi:hypothetical protein
MRVTTVEGEWSVVVRPFLSSKRSPHFQTRKSLGQNKNMAVGPNETQNQMYYAGEGQ